ncbi:MAG: hypothetical protein ACT4OX_15275 [Actinomycetota bacterium]
MEYSLALAVEAQDGSAKAGLSRKELAVPLEQLEAMYGASLLRYATNFDANGAAKPIEIVGADGALVLNAQLDTTIGAYRGPGVGAFVIAKRGDDAYVLSVVAKDEPGNDVLVEEIARSLSIE